MSKERQDKLVRATDLDALSCRISANRKGYFVPPDSSVDTLLSSYHQNLQYCEGYTQLSAGRTLRAAFAEPKYPLINKGTYFRTDSVNRLVQEFVAEWKTCQIVALGGGSDTRCFRVLESHPTVSYTEIDFAESTKIKKIAISNTPHLRALVGAGDMRPIEVSSRDEFRALDPELHSQNYHLVALDLRDIAARGHERLAFLDRALPTLVISECVLCYLTPEQNVAVLDYCKTHFAAVSVVLYDPMSLGDTFGDTMAQNLSKRGLNLLTFVQYPDLRARKALFETVLGFKAHLSDLASIGGYGEQEHAWICASEQARVSRLEMIDEVEEIRLLLRHYCLIYAESGMESAFTKSFRWLQV